MAQIATTFVLAVFKLPGRAPKRAEDPITLLREGLHGGIAASAESMFAALGEVVENSTWSAQGRFETFGHFVVAKKEEGGLGVRDAPAAKLLRAMLLELRCYADWLLVLRLIARKQGRPKSMDDRFQPFFHVPTAATAVDRMLLVLDRDHPEMIRLIETDALTPLEAARRVGLLPKLGPRFGGVCDISGAAALSEPAQGKLLCRLFRALSLNAQCQLIRTVENVLGGELAKAWRAHHAQGSCDRISDLAAEG